MISDTHDLLRPEVAAELRGVDRILHCGDICSPEVLAEIEAIAPVLAVRGNCDQGPWADVLPLRRTVRLHGWGIHMVHDRADLQPGVEGDVDLVLFGHSHRSTFEERAAGAVLLNPGSAGPRRFELPVAVARLRLYEDHFSLEQVEWEAT